MIILEVPNLILKGKIEMLLNSAQLSKKRIENYILYIPDYS